MMQATAVTPIYYDLSPSSGWEPDVDQIVSAIRDDTRAIIWNFPSNPTGAVPDPDAFSQVERVAGRRGILVIRDDVYAGLCYSTPTDDPFSSEAGDVVSVRSFSKLFGLAGERLGYALGPEDVISKAGTIHWYLGMSPPATAQGLALSLLRSDPLGAIAELREGLRVRRQLACEILGLDGRLECVTPRGGFFLWLKVRDCPIGPREFAQRCSNEEGVAIVPGTAFGIETPTYFRLSFAVGKSTLRQGIAGIRRLVRRLGSRNGDRTTWRSVGGVSLRS